MAYPKHRSWNAGLFEGITDGVYKKANNSWETDDTLTAQARKQMSGIWHGFNEVNPKILPDGRSVTTKSCDIAPSDRENK